MGSPVNRRRLQGKAQYRQQPLYRADVAIRKSLGRIAGPGRNHAVRRIVRVSAWTDRRVPKRHCRGEIIGRALGTDFLQNGKPGSFVSAYQAFA